MKVHIKTDTHGDESLAPIFVMALVFLATVVLLTVTMAEFLTQAEGAYDVHEGRDIMGDIELDWVSPESGYSITDANVTQNPADDDSWQKLEFSPDGWDWLTVRIVRNSSFEYRGLTEWGISGYSKQARLYEDFIMLHGKSQGRDRWKAVPYSQILRGDPIGDNITAAYVSLLGANITLVVETFNGAENHSALIWENEYLLKIAANNLFNSLASGSMWAILGQMVTFHLPTTDPYTGLILAAAFWGTVGFMFAMVVSRFIPFISGG